LTQKGHKCDHFGVERWWLDIGPFSLVFCYLDTSFVFSFIAFSLICFCLEWVKLQKEKRERGHKIEKVSILLSFFFSWCRFLPQEQQRRAFGDLKRATKDKSRQYYITNPRSQVSFLFGLEKDAFAFFFFLFLLFSRIERERENSTQQRQQSRK